MQNRGALWIFTILLALACLWQLSFSLFTSRVEREAREQATFLADSVMAVPGNAMADRDSVLIVMENRVLRDRAEEKIYPVFGYSYRECKEKEINLGLDLKGGMAVTLEVSIPELVANLSENSNDATFQAVMTAAHARQSSSTEDFITLFANEWNKQAPNAKMAAVFHSADKKDMFPAKPPTTRSWRPCAAKPRPPSTTPRTSSATASTSSAWPSPASRSSSSAAGSKWNFPA